ncbi:MAG: hypothetical protein AB199_01650 [Parcubacteria bacterium C7867-004]|nr:MAG: hypothetical protein AB199_01650 [Parcubacteria bacterium C7867-004]
MKYLALLILAILFVPQSALAAVTKPTATTSTISADTNWSFNRLGKGINVGSQIEKQVEYTEDELVNAYRYKKGKLANHEQYSSGVKVDKNDLAVWNIFEGISGKAFAEKYVYALLTYKEPQSAYLAYVQTLASKDKSWQLSVNVNAVDLNNKKWTRDMAITLVHEYAHILTLNNAQMKKGKGLEASCLKVGDTFWVARYGCTKEDSYLGMFVKAFWTPADIMAYRAAQKKGDEAGLYKGQNEAFVTPYAATSPVEDIAESFTDFVLQQKPVGTTSIRDKKIHFFYQYPELVKMRTQIRASISKYF